MGHDKPWFQQGMDRPSLVSGVSEPGECSSFLEGTLLNGKKETHRLVVFRWSGPVGW